MSISTEIQQNAEIRLLTGEEISHVAGGMIVSPLPWGGVPWLAKRGLCYVAHTIGSAVSNVVQEVGSAIKGAANAVVDLIKFW